MVSMPLSLPWTSVAISARNEELRELKKKKMSVFKSRTSQHVMRHLCEYVFSRKFDALGGWSLLL